MLCAKSAFGPPSAALELLNAGDGASVAHLGSRTGVSRSPAPRALERASITGVDVSPAALERAHDKAAALGGSASECVESETLPTSLDAGIVHPVGHLEARWQLFREMYGLLFTGGQALVALPLRGFQEVGDLFREYALKNPTDLGKVVEETMAARHTIETCPRRWKTRDSTTSTSRSALPRLPSTAAARSDPVSCISVLPDMKTSLNGAELEQPLACVRDAIDKDWSEDEFELTLNVGCAGARRLD